MRETIKEKKIVMRPPNEIVSHPKVQNQYPITSPAGWIKSVMVMNIKLVWTMLCP